MDILDLLKGKRMSVMTEVGVAVELEIKEVKEEHHSRNLEKATRENDWWPRTEDWTTFDVTFTTGYKKSYRSLSEIKIIEE